MIKRESKKRRLNLGWLAVAVIVGVSILPAALVAGGVTEEWVARYNGPGNYRDWAYAMGVDTSGNVYVGGAIWNGTSYDYATIKYDTNGNQEWVATYNGPGNGYDEIYVRSVAVDGSGNVYVTGQSKGSGTGQDCATIKYDTNGNEQWVARYNGPVNRTDTANAIALDNSGNVYVTGIQNSGSGTGADYATIKYDTNGNEQWVATYDGPANDYDRSDAIAVDSSGNVYVAGYSAGNGTSWDYATVKYDSNGNEQWAARYNGPGNEDDMAHCIALDSSGNVYVTGYQRGSDTSYDYATVKYDTNGNEEWVATYSGPVNADGVATSIAVDSSGNVYVTGRSYGIDTSADSATVKYDTDGNEKWVARYNGAGNGVDYTYAIAVDDSANVYVTGRTWSGTSYDHATVKYDTNGNEKWVAMYNGPGNGEDVPLAIALDGSGNVYVTGASTGIGTDWDYTTIKYSQDNTPPTAQIASPSSGLVHAINSPIAFEGSFTDPDPYDTHTAIWTISNENWPEDYEVEGTVSGTLVSDTLDFPEAGIDSIKLTVTDDAGASGEATTVNNDPECPAFIVIYDPDGGFVTGGGWIYSPAGSLSLDPSAEGKASFGFVAKYKKGATVPQGNTEFRFQAGNFRFKSSSYDWLVIAGSRAKFKGQGSIDGMGEGFGFMLTAVDDDNGDRFRIKIWDATTEPEQVIYDNKQGEDDDAELDDTTIIGGGSIVIHKN